MINVDTIESLIDQISELRTRFKIENVQMFSSYDFSQRMRKPGFISVETIYKDEEFIKWRDQLLYELGQIDGDKFVDEIIHLLNHFSGFGDKSRFDKLTSKLMVLKEHLDEYRNVEIEVQDDERIPEKEIGDRVLRALLKLQRNSHYGSSDNEDTMNDYIRDILDENYTVKDQTRQGTSESGGNAGEIDIQICSDGLPVVMIEAVKLSSLSKEVLSKHISKVLTKYDPNGCPYAFILIYCTAARFNDFHKKLLDYLSDFSFPFPRETKITDVDTGYGEIKHATCIINRNEKRVRVHVYATHIQ